jgi:hypothetical protein
MIALGKEFSTSVVLFQEALAARLGLNATDYRCSELMLRRGPMTAKSLAEEVRLTTGVLSFADHLEGPCPVPVVGNLPDGRDPLPDLVPVSLEFQRLLEQHAQTLGWRRAAG